MVTVIEPRTLKADDARDVARSILNAEVRTSEIYAFQLGGVISELYNIIDSLEYVKPVKCPNGQYQIVEEPNGSLVLLSSNYEKYELCYDERRVIKRYLNYLYVRVVNGVGRRSQIQNTEFMLSMNMDGSKWYTKQTYHYIPINMYKIEGDIIKFYSDFISDTYVQSYIQEMNTSFEKALIDNERETKDWFDGSVDYTNIRDICKVAYFDNDIDKLNSVMNQMKEMFKGLTSYQVGELVDKGALERINEFNELKGLPPELMPTVCLRDILMSTYNNIKMEANE